MNQPLNEYLKNKEIRHNMPYHFNGATGNKGYMLTTETIMSDESINEMFPLGEKVTLWDFNNKGENPDKKRVI